MEQSPEREEQPQGQMEEGAAVEVAAEQVEGQNYSQKEMVELGQQQSRELLMQQQQMMAAAMQQEPQHFFDALQADEFRMPNSFEVEIRMTEKQVAKRMKLRLKS